MIHIWDNHTHLQSWAAIEVGLEKVENQIRKENAGIEGLKAGTGKSLGREHYGNNINED